MQIQRKNIYKNQMNFFKNLAYDILQYPTKENRKLPIYKLNSPLSEGIQNVRLIFNQILLLY